MTLNKGRLILSELINSLQTIPSAIGLFYQIFLRTNSEGKNIFFNSTEILSMIVKGRSDFDVIICDS